MAPVVCKCGKSFKAEAAMQQHQRDSPKHEKQPEISISPVLAAQVALTTATPTTVVSKTESALRCSCGQSFKHSQALAQHKRDSPKHQQQLETSTGPGLAAHVTPTTASPTPVVSKTESALHCSCGQSFKHRHALEQHKRDSPKHKGAEPQPPKSQDGGPAANKATSTQSVITPITSFLLVCSCGQVFKTPNARTQHQQDSPKHQHERPASKATVESHVVKEGESPSATKSTKKKASSKKNNTRRGPPYGSGYNRWGVDGSSYSGRYQSEGEDYGLCDKDCADGGGMGEPVVVIL
ncbi:uncharacterized protein C8A04DRAFT_29171 [Dichotomopilus funicola]|uniref:C2H2-type domain-containing protein n=1 Tax=Dichotomopilus funicola TaxID=1934379 RepID=A0AAN6ZMK7_9PEZI|nr:hypothetical protein C8A04DRAFT_29171 [Dichotomopilus funicola]